MGFVQLIFLFLRSVLRSQTELAAENLALRQQLAILKEKTKLPREISPDLVDEDFSSGVFSHSVHELNAGDYVGYEC